MNEKSMLTKGIVLKGAKSEYTVIDVISERGGQGGVYKAKDLKGNIWAMKWYWKDDAAQKKRIMDLCVNGIPASLRGLKECKFIWPKDMVYNQDSFGYIMECVDLSNYSSIEGVILSKNPIDYEETAKISINICKGFDKLHSGGYCYKDISGGNIHFSLKDHTVIVMDVDNIRPNTSSEKSDVLGTLGFIAPEIARGECSPNTKSDRFSVAVMLFMLWGKHNPFEGTKVVLYEGTNELQDLYTHPVFIFDPKDKSNTAETDPKESWAKDFFAWPRAWWAAMPSLLKEQFTRSFTVELDPSKRNTTDSMWVRLFERLLSEGHLEPCKKCKKKIAVEATKCVFCNEKHTARKAAAQQPAPQPQQPQMSPPQIQQPAPTPIPAPTPTPKTLQNRIVVEDNGVRTVCIDLKNGSLINGADISPTLAPLGNIFEVCAKDGDEALLGLKNLSYYAFKVCYRGGENKVLKSGIATLIRNVEKIILPANILLYIE